MTLGLAPSVTVVAIVIGWGVLAFMAQLSAGGVGSVDITSLASIRDLLACPVFGLLPVMAHSATQLSGLWHSTISVAFVTRLP